MLPTNHPERLDAALLRPGRVDRRIAFDNANPEQAERLFLRFFPGETALAQRFGQSYGDGSFSMADLQGRLLRLRDSPRRAAQGPAETAHLVVARGV